MSDPPIELTRIWTRYDQTVAAKDNNITIGRGYDRFVPENCAKSTVRGNTLAAISMTLATRLTILVALHVAIFLGHQ